VIDDPSVYMSVHEKQPDVSPSDWSCCLGTSFSVYGRIWIMNTDYDFYSWNEPAGMTTIIYEFKQHDLQPDRPTSLGLG
jgi:hypothetical protein